MNELYFYEERRLGAWRPVTSPTSPEIRGGRLVRAEGLGPRVRCDTRVDREHIMQPLSTLQEIYGGI